MASENKGTDEMVGGRYVCPHPDCDKTFSRYEHLQRHKLNHWPKEIFRCDYVYPEDGIVCNRSFVRKDLLVRHQRRHSNNGVRMQMKVRRELGKVKGASGSQRRLSETPDQIQVGQAHEPGRLVPETNSSTNSNSYSNANGNLATRKLDHIVLDVGDGKSKSGATGESNSATASAAGPIGGVSTTTTTTTTTSSSNASLNSGFALGGSGGGGTGTGTGSGMAPNTNLNNFFNWLFAAAPTQEAATPAVAAGGPPPPPHAVGTAPNTNVAQQSHISVNNNNNNNIASTGMVPGLPQTAMLEPEISSQNNQHVQSSSFETDTSGGGTTSGSGTGSGSATVANIMDDLFSVDFLPNDPLQSLVQQMSYNNMNNNSQPVSVGSLNTPPNKGSTCSPESVPNRSPKFRDFGKEHIKDNLQAQKSKVEELRSQLKRSESIPGASSSTPGAGAGPSTKRQKTMLLSKPSFFNSDPNSKFRLSLERQAVFAEQIADIKYILLSDLQTALKSYWLNFHPQYPILHKPSFDIEKAPSILVLSMIMTGASYLGSANRRSISDVIAGPLRWLIFSHEDFQPTSETYIIQALLLLECYEKTSTNRYLHERSYLHHGTTIQLLRRTPSLGGHPLRIKKEQSPSNYESMEEIYKNWIDFETLKRTALYAFYIDTTHAVVFGYTYLFIHCNQVQLSLPCSDEIWDSYDLSLEKLLQHGFGGKDVSFLDTLKQLLNHVMHRLQRSGNTEPWTKLKTSKFGEKLLLSGLISIMFQLQQHSEVISLGGDNPLSVQNIHWQEIISFAIDYWHSEVMHGCQNSSNSVLSNVDAVNTVDDEGIKLLRLDDVHSCKIPAYHMSQIILRIFQYDYYIYAGAPWRMNVCAGTEEYALVSERILKFSQDPMQGGMAIVYAYMFLFEMFQNGENLSCDVNLDYCITRPNTLALTSLLIWSYNYSLYGPETHIWDNSSDTDENLNKKLKEEYVPIESFQQHLKRMYSYLHVDKNLDVYTHHQQLKEKARLLKDIPNKNHLAGMMLFMRDLFHGCYWELGREFSHLFDNCLERSMGRAKVVCEHMYET